MTGHELKVRSLEPVIRRLNSKLHPIVPTSFVRPRVAIHDDLDAVKLDAVHSTRDILCSQPEILKFSSPLHGATLMS
jgi:hypothetical protein